MRSCVRCNAVTHSHSRREYKPRYTRKEGGEGVNTNQGEIKWDHVGRLKQKEQGRQWKEDPVEAINNPNSTHVSHTAPLLAFSTTASIARASTPPAWARKYAICTAARAATMMPARAATMMHFALSNGPPTTLPMRGAGRTKPANNHHQLVQDGKITASSLLQTAMSDPLRFAPRTAASICKNQPSPGAASSCSISIHGECSRDDNNIKITSFINLLISFPTPKSPPPTGDLVADRQRRGATADCIAARCPPPLLPPPRNNGRGPRRNDGKAPSG